MKENFLQHVWLYQQFDKTGLRTTSGETLKVLKTGLPNQNSGPDFFNAHIQINDQLWVGTVEVHLKSSDWYAHHHETDLAYDNVILHIVWEEDVPVFRKNNSPVSTLELKGKVSRFLLDTYGQLSVKDSKWIPCENLISKIDDFTWQSWLERLYIERLQVKNKLISRLLQENQNDWEKVFFMLLAKNFGLKTNGESFFEMARLLDYSIIRKERFESVQLEALLLGINNLLVEKPVDNYQKELQEIYRYQKHKYQLEQSTLTPQFFRLRPPNFPTVRLSQLANLLAKEEHLFDRFIQAKDVQTLYNLLTVKTSSYWETHYVFGKEHAVKVKKTTREFLDLLLINTVVPLKFAYQNYLGDRDNSTVLEILTAVKPEKNHITEGFQKMGFRLENALQTQSLLMLKNGYCEPQKCLECAVGLKILHK